MPPPLGIFLYIPMGPPVHTSALMTFLIQNLSHCDSQLLTKNIPEGLKRSLNGSSIFPNQ